MSRRTAIMLTLCGMATAAPAGWDGFPLVNTATNYITWEQMLADLDEHPFQQLVNALNERRAAANLAALQRVYTNSVGPATNETTITWTNKWGFFEALPGVTAAAPVVRADILAFDAALRFAVSNFVSTNADDGSYTLTNWFSDFRPDLPVETWPGLLARTGAGLVTNRTTYSYILDHHFGTPAKTTGTTDFVMGGDAWLLRTPPTVSYWPVAEIRWSTSGWSLAVSTGGFIATNDGARMHDPAVLPSLVFDTTNLVPACSLSITGLVLDLQDFTGAQGGIATGETVAVLAGATATVCTLPWQSVTTIGCTVTGTWGDVVRLVYTNAVYTVGDYPRDLHAADLDERWRLVDALRMTHRIWTVPAAAGSFARSTYSTDYTPYYPPKYTLPNFATQDLRWVESGIRTRTNNVTAYKIWAGGKRDAGIDNEFYFGERYVGSNSFGIYGISTSCSHSAVLLTRGWMGVAFNWTLSNIVCDIDGLWMDVSGVGTNRTVPFWVSERGYEGRVSYSGFHRTDSQSAATIASRYDADVRALYNASSWVNPCDPGMSTNRYNMEYWGMSIDEEWGFYDTKPEAYWLLRWDVTNGFDYVSE